MTPLTFAQDLAADLATRGAPQPAHGQLGEVVLDCAGTIVSILTQSEYDLGNNCGAIDLVDVVASITRDCSLVKWRQQMSVTPSAANAASCSATSSAVPATSASGGKPR